MGSAADGVAQSTQARWFVVATMSSPASPPCSVGGIVRNRQPEEADLRARWFLLRSRALDVTDVLDRWN
jgi:hypothetical protein